MRGQIREGAKNVVPTLIQAFQDEGSGVRRYSAARVLGERGIRLMKQLKLS